MTELETKLQNVVNASVKVELTSGTLLTSAQMLLRLGLPLVILVGTTLLIGGGIDFFTYLLFLLAASRVYEPLSGVMMQLSEIFNANLQIKRMKEMEQIAVRIKDMTLPLTMFPFPIRTEKLF